MSILSFDIQPSAESNDHQVRILIDGEDFLGDRFLGIDPPEFFAQFDAPKEYLLVGRCTCGAVGCGDYPVRVQRAESVEWLVSDVIVAQFDPDQYHRALSTAATDYSWDPKVGVLNG